MKSALVAWSPVNDYQDITYHKADGIVRIAFNRPDVRNAFRPQTIDEMIDAFEEAWSDEKIGVVLLTGNGPAKDGKYAFALVAIKGFAVTQVISVKTAVPASMCSVCSALFAISLSLSSHW